MTAESLDSRLIAAADSLAYLRCALHAEAVRDGLAAIVALRARADGTRRELEAANETIAQYRSRERLSEQGGDDLYLEGLRKALGGVPDGSAESLARWLEYHAGGFGRGPFPRQLKKSADMMRELSAEVVALREALRKYAITAKIRPPCYVCELCENYWTPGEPERHFAGCLAEKDKGG